MNSLYFLIVLGIAVIVLLLFNNKRKSSRKLPLELAQEGDLEAQFKVGEMYERGDGVKQDSKEAFAWFSLAAEQGHTDALEKLGHMYATGEGVAQDKKTAVNCYLKAFEQGVTSHGIGLLDLGKLCFNGDDKTMPPDHVEGYKWIEIFKLCAMFGALPKMINPRTGDGIKWVKQANGELESFARQMTPEQIAQAEKLAQEWWSKHQQPVMNYEVN